MMTNIKKVGLIAAMFLLPVAAYANHMPGHTTSGGGCGGGGGLQNPLSVCSLTEFLVQVLNALQLIIFPFIVLFLVYGGFLFISAQGNEEKLKNAKRIFLWTLIGALVILGAEVLSRAVDATISNLQ